ncbi:CLUMA_CG013818, isoform A [Clunio marinus]|uniref:CLUMA_CG013818, isoform A n=1 Tax=Clunio marinus TaxID=568069 RepID=A0A1J1IN86_9DIPT|nr:CLUMA_CG013818, isoform A [Clunio marinus]
MAFNLLRQTSEIVELEVKLSSLVVYARKFNVCSQPKSSIPQMVLFAISYLGIPLHCPMNNNPNFCYQNENILTFSSNTRKIISYFSTDNRDVILKVNINHDTGKSCLTFNAKDV